MRYRWDNYSGLMRELYIASYARDSNLEMRKKCHLFEAFFQSVCRFVWSTFSLFERSFLRVAYFFITRENSEQRWMSGRRKNWMIGDLKNISKLLKVSTVSTNIVTTIWPLFFHFLFGKFVPVWNQVVWCTMILNLNLIKFNCLEFLGLEKILIMRYKSI